MEHIHPILVHFPIALFISALGMEVLSLVFRKELLHQAAWINYILGTAGAFFAVLTAVIEDHGLHHPVFYAHRAMGLLTLTAGIVSVLVLFFVKGKSVKAYRTLFFILIALTAVFAGITGYYGGRLVYEYGVGVE